MTTTTMKIDACKLSKATIEISRMRAIADTITMLDQELEISDASGMMKHTLSSLGHTMIDQAESAREALMSAKLDYEDE